MKGKLPRLDPAHYRGHAYVFWTHTTEQRKLFSLNSECHLNFREILLHACLRYRLATPVYCIMPDHIHLLWIGLAPESDQSIVIFEEIFWSPNSTTHMAAATA